MSNVFRAALGLVLMLFCACGAKDGSGGGTTPPVTVDPTNPHGNGQATFGPQLLQFSCTPHAGIAPLKSTCTIQGGHPAGSPLTCTLTAQGKKTELGDCTVPVTREVVVEQPGTVDVQLVIQDQQFLTVGGKVTLEGQMRPNTAPVIETLTGTPMSGVPPFTSVVNFTVTDAENDATTCSLDVGGDGTIEFANFPCTQTGAPIDVKAIGSLPIVLKAVDALGLSVSKTLTLTGKAPVAEIRISKVEWGQSVILETLRLVEGKAALLRVHVLADKPNLGKVSVDAEVRNAAGTVLGKVVLTGPASPPTAEAPTTLAQQWTGVVDAAWIAPGIEVRLKADSTDAFEEADELNNSKTLKPTVGRGNVMQLTKVPVVNGGATGITFDAQPIMQRFWPLKGLDQTVRTPYTFTGSITAFSSAGWGTLLQNLANVRQADGSKRNYYGFVKVNYQSGVAGIGYVGEEAATGRDDSPDTLAHELGHNMGRNHAPCGGAAGADANYPYAGAKVGSWGWDSQGGKLMNPATYYDLMAYCPPEWVSDYNYKAVQTFLEAQPNIIGGGTQMNVVMVSGVFKNGKAALRPVQRLYGTPSEAQDGAHLLRLTALDGTVTNAVVGVKTVGDLDEQHFSALLPDVGPLASVELLAGPQVLAKSVARTTEQPKLQLTRVDASTVRLQWDAARFPTATVAHFSDTGERTTLGFWLEGGDVRVRTDGLVGGHFEVGASDGVNSAFQNVSAD